MWGYNWWTTLFGWWYICFFLLMGIPSRHHGCFNTKMVMTWMIWGYPCFRKPPYGVIPYIYILGMITIHELGHHINSPVSRDDRGFLTLLNWGQLGYWALSCIFYMLICESVSATKSESLFTMIFPTIQLTIFRSILRQTAMKFFPTFFANKWKLLGPTTPNILHLFKCSFECRVSWQLPCLAET